MKCQDCKQGASLDFKFTMAFQPIVDVQKSVVWGYEALVRGVNGEPAGRILAMVNDSNKYKFDQACRVKAIELAGALFPLDDTKLSINFMPNAVYEPTACIRASLDAAKRVNFDPKRLMFEFTENEQVGDPAHLQKIISAYRQMGFTTAIDDFGAGFSGLNLLAKFQPDIIKIDMDLIRKIDTSTAKQAILASLTWLARELGVTILAEGIETANEMAVVRAAGVTLMQGYLFARPTVKSLPHTEFAVAA